jgi:hypothetical protein
MKRRHFLNSALSAAFIGISLKNHLVFGKNIFNENHQTTYNGKNLCIITKSEMLEKAKKLNIHIPFCKMDHHKSNIIQEMKDFVDQSTRFHFYDYLEKNIYGCCEGVRSKNGYGELEIYFTILALHNFENGLSALDYITNNTKQIEQTND